MVYLLLVFFPIAMSASCFLLRKQTQVVIVAAIATTLVQMVLVTRLPLDMPTRLLGLVLILEPLGRLFLLAFFGGGVVAFAVTWQVPHGENFVPIALLILGLVAAMIVLSQEVFTVSLLLVCAGLAAVLAIVDLPTGSPALVGRAALATAIKYLVLMLIAGVVMSMGFVLLSIPGGATDRMHLILALLAAGFGLRIAAVPFHSWLPDLVEDASPMVSVFVITVINITSLLFLISTFQYYPALVSENVRGMTILMDAGVLTVVLGAFLALGQRNMRRMFGYLVVYNAGMMFFGLTTISSAGLTGAVFEAFNQVIAVLLIFLCLGLLERPDGRPANVVRRDLLWRWPIAGSGLLGGGLALLGVPPFSGFTSKVLIYQAAFQRGQGYLVLLLCGTGLGVLALLQVAYLRLLGPAEDVSVEETPILLGTSDLDRPAKRLLAPEPRVMAVLAGLLLALSVVVGVYPGPFLTTISEAIRGLTFIGA